MENISFIFDAFIGGIKKTVLYYTGIFFYMCYENAPVIMNTAINNTSLIENPNMKHVLLGVGVSRSGMWISRKIDESTGVNIGTLLNRIPTRLEFQVYMKISDPIRRKIINPVFNRARTLINEDILSLTLAPILEEAVFRLGLQSGIAYFLRLCGINEILSKSIAIFCTSYIFTQAHGSTDPKSAEFNDRLIPGIVFGIIKEFGNFPELVLTHSLHNLSIQSRRYLNKIFNPSKSF